MTLILRNDVYTSPFYKENGARRLRRTVVLRLCRRGHLENHQITRERRLPYLMNQYQRRAQFAFISVKEGQIIGSRGKFSNIH